MAIDGDLTLNDKVVTKLGQLQTAVTGGQSGTSENKNTVLQLGVYVFAKCSFTYIQVSLISSDVSLL